MPGSWHRPAFRAGKSGLQRAHFFQKYSWEVAEGQGPSWGIPHLSSPQGLGSARFAYLSKVTLDHERNVGDIATSPQIFSTSRSGLSAMTEKLPISHAYVFLFCFKAKITPLSISRLPRGSSNSFLWPSLLNFPLFNLLNKQISMDTAARY